MGDSYRYHELEERTFQFAKSVNIHCRNMTNQLENMEYKKQVIRSSASVGANLPGGKRIIGKKGFRLPSADFQERGEGINILVKIIM